MIKHIKPGSKLQKNASNELHVHSVKHIKTSAYSVVTWNHQVNDKHPLGTAIPWLLEEGKKSSIDSQVNNELQLDPYCHIF